MLLDLITLPDGVRGSRSGFHAHGSRRRNVYPRSRWQRRSKRSPAVMETIPAAIRRVCSRPCRRKPTPRAMTRRICTSLQALGMGHAPRGTGFHRETSRSIQDPDHGRTNPLVVVALLANNRITETTVHRETNCMAG